MTILYSHDNPFDAPLCEARVCGAQRVVRIESRFDHQQFAHPQRVLPIEAPRREWVEVHGDLYYEDPRRSPASGDAHNRSLLASVTAWYYPEERTLTLWGITGARTLLERPGNAIASDHTLAEIWRRLEGFLLTCFPDTARMITLATPFVYEDENRSWRDFLHHQGYGRHEGDDRRWSKQL